MLEARPPAKVNLTLEVVGRRDDGFHELRSIFLRVGLTDRLTMAPGTGPADRLTVTGLPGIPTEGNLVLEALDALRRHLGVDLPPLDVTLEKRIPAAAGLGGGSSDAASALSLAQAAWQITLDPDDVLSVAADIGSDVPFFAADTAAALVEGRGEWITPLLRVESVGLLLVTPPIRLQTGTVFARFDDLPRAEGATVAHIPDPVDLLADSGRLRDAERSLAGGRVARTGTPCVARCP